MSILSKKDIFFCNLDDKKGAENFNFLLEFEKNLLTTFLNLTGNSQWKKCDFLRRFEYFLKNTLTLTVIV